MKRMFVLAAVLCLGLFSGLGNTGLAEEAEKHPIDLALEKRIEADSSTAGMINATSDAAKEWDKLLNANYNALMKRLSKEEQEKLRSAQREWLKFRDQEFDFSRGFWGGFDGSMYRAMSIGYECDFIRARALKLGSYLESLDEK